MKKALKIMLYALLCIVLVILVGSYIAYSTYWAKDPEFKIDSTNLAYFHDTYDECRTDFLKSIETLTDDFDGIAKGKFSIPSEVDNDLSLDWCYIPAKKQNPLWPPAAPFSVRRWCSRVFRG